MADERIMVVPRELMLPGGVRHYMAVPIDEGDLQESIYQHAQPLMRSEAEVDETFSQVIPYVMLEYGDAVIGARRLRGGSDARLHDSYLAGFGGHVRWQDDVEPHRLVERSVRHELNEELGLSINMQVPPFTHLIVDDTNPVGRVHVGLLTTIDLAELDIDPFTLESNEPEKLQLFSLSPVFLEHHRDKLEGWARLALSTRV